MYDFEYQRPASVAEAVAAGGGDTKFLAGGQSLVQAMKLRLANSAQIVDLGGIATLRGITVGPSSVKIGAMTRHAEVAASAELRAAIPALAVLAEGIGDPMVRNMGTIGGSIANADPAACYPSAVLALGATIHTDRRTIGADGFFKGLYETALAADELITAVEFPRVQRSGYAKLRQPASRFAIVGVFVAQAAGGVRVAVTGAASHVFRATAIEQALAKDFRPEAAAAVEMPAGDLANDLHASADYRAAMISAMAARAVAQALGG